jgi:hypothetical protein
VVAIHLRELKRGVSIGFCLRIHGIDIPLPSSRVLCVVRMLQTELRFYTSVALHHVTKPMSLRSDTGDDCELRYCELEDEKCWVEWQATAVKPQSRSEPDSSPGQPTGKDRAFRRRRGVVRVVRLRMKAGSWECW